MYQVTKISNHAGYFGVTVKEYKEEDSVAYMLMCTVQSFKVRTGSFISFAVPILLLLSETLVEFPLLYLFLFSLPYKKQTDCMISKIPPVLEICDYIVYCFSEETILTKNNVNFSPSK